MLRFCQLNVLIYLLGIPLARGQNTVLTTTTTFPGGTDNVLIGPANTYSGGFAGKRNLAIGSRTAESLTDGINNVFIGNYAGYQATSANRNTAVGSESGNDLSTGSDNVFLGSRSGRSITTGSSNTMVGNMAGILMTTGSSNCFMGANAGSTSNASLNNTFAGPSSGRSTTSGGNNTFLGMNTGLQNSSGAFNTFFGERSGEENLSANGNTAFGIRSGRNNTTGTNNVFLGRAAGIDNEKGSYNVFLGWGGLGSGNVRGSYNTFLGHTANSTGSFASSLERSTALGYNALVGKSDAVVLGDSISVRVGIGTSTPNHKLTIRGNVNFLAFDNSLRLKNRPFLHWDENENLALGLGATIDSGTKRALFLGGESAQIIIPGGEAQGSGLVLASYMNNQPLNQVLTTNATGELELAPVLVRANQADQWQGAVFSTDYHLLPFQDVQRYIDTHRHLPGLPSGKEMATEGMDLSELLSGQRAKIEELTLYVAAMKEKNEFLNQQASQIDALRQLLSSLQATLDARIKNRVKATPSLKMPNRGFQPIF